VTGCDANDTCHENPEKAVTGCQRMSQTVMIIVTVMDGHDRRDIHDIHDSHDMHVLSLVRRNVFHTPVGRPFIHFNTILTTITNHTWHINSMNTNKNIN
jgi:hypothetical protein